jgi:hypothetical protein
MSEMLTQAARRLTVAQRRKLLAIENGQPKEFPLHASGLFLIERGFVFVNELGARHLTDNGHAMARFLRGAA